GLIMAISGKKRQEIIGAIEDLYRTTGQIPTVVGVIEAMGGGSPSYVTPVLRERREAMSEGEQVNREMTVSVKRVMDEALVAVWSRAVQEADRDLAAYREAAEREKKELLEERNLALSELEKVEAALEQQKIELNGALAQNQALKQANVELEE